MRRPVLSAPTLAHPGVTHQVAQVSIPEGAVCHHPIPGAATRPAPDGPTHSEPRQGLTRRAAIGLGQFGGVEVGQSNLDPSPAADARDSLDTQAVAVTDVNDRAAEGGSGAQLGGHAAPVGDARAGVRQDGAGERGEGQGENEGSDHPCSVTQDTGAGRLFSPEEEARIREIVRPEQSQPVLNDQVRLQIEATLRRGRLRG